MVVKEEHLFIFSTPKPLLGKHILLIFHRHVIVLVIQPMGKEMNIKISTCNLWGENPRLRIGWHEDMIF